MIIHQRQALNRPGTATQEKGLARLLSILNAAREVFVEEGYARFTMRKVARAAGISIGNLNYYYRTKDDLLRDLLDYITNTYLEEFDRRREYAGAEPEKQLAAVLEFWIQDLTTPETTAFFPEVWAMANHDAYVAELVHVTYTRAREAIVELIPAINPALSNKQVDELAVYICAAMEGLTVFAGYEKPWAKQMPALKGLTVSNFLDLVRRTPGDKRQRSRQ